MDSPAVLHALRWLAYDTFRQTLASRVFWIMLGLTGLCTVFCLGVSVEGPGVQRDDWELLDPTGAPLTGPNPRPARMGLLFGAFHVPMHRDAAAQVRLVQTILGSWVAGSLGVLLALAWTAGFLPDFLQPGAAAVLLAKPVPRGLLVAGKFVGVVGFVAVQAALFFAATWVALGLRTGVWPAGYLLGAPLFVIHFAAVYSFSVLLAVTFRSTTACVLGVVLFWGLCYALNYGRHAAVAYPQLAPGQAPPSALTGALVGAAYWLLPKPADFTLMLEHALDAGADLVTLSAQPAFATVIDLGEFHPILSVLSAFLFCGLMLALAAYELGQAEY